MIKTIVLPIGLAFITLLVVIPIPRVNDLNLSYQLLEGKKGWGYDILVNGTPLIHQETIPGLERSSAFTTKAQALACVKIMLQKLEQKQSPELNKEEQEAVLHTR